MRSRLFSPTTYTKSQKNANYFTLVIRQSGSTDWQDLMACNLVRIEESDLLGGIFERSY